MEKILLNVEGVKTLLESGENVLRAVDMQIRAGETHVIMGPNGSGKSTLANTIMGNPIHRMTGGRIELEGEDISGAGADIRAKKGIFMAFQTPEEIEGVTVEDFLKTAKNAVEDKPMKLFAFKKEIQQTMKDLNFGESYATRYLNVGFSGGEKKKSEILQMLMLEPKLAILDEIDSGLDVDAVKIVTEGIRHYKNENNSLLIISHSRVLLDQLKVDFVHVLVKGKIVCTGDRSLIEEISENGFARFTAEGFHEN